MNLRRISTALLLTAAAAPVLGLLTASPPAHAAIGSDSVVPAVPSNLTATAVSPTSVRLTWTNNAANQSGVVISRDGVESVDLQGATVSSYTWSGLSRGTEYAFWVASKIYGTPGDPTGYGNTQSAWVGPVYVTTIGQPAPPAAPTHRLTVPFATELGSAGDPNSGSNNCGPASITMAILYYGGSITVQDAAVAIRGAGNNTLQNGFTNFKDPSSQALLARFSLVEHNITAWGQVKREIDAGRPVITLVNNNAYRYLIPPPYSSNSDLWFTPSHIIVVTGYDATNVYVNDPLRSSRDYAIPVATFMNAASTTPGANSGNWYAVSVARA
jgi:Peptidase_C39 like family/Fibronectin type III domain